MRSILILFLFSLFLTTNEAKVLNICKLGKMLKDVGLDGYSGYNLANWVCMIKHESNYNTQAKNSKYADGSTSYGIFQVNNRLWCTDNKYHSKNYCNIACSKLLDDNISDDVQCAKKIVRDPNGMNVWTAWRDNCKGKNVSKYVSVCNL